MGQAARLLPIVLVLPAAPAFADILPEQCADGLCTTSLTPAQLVDHASSLVLAHRFDEARPLVAALVAVPTFAFERHFLTGYMAAENGQLDAAIEEFRAALAIQPRSSRVRLELARALMLAGKDGSADYHFRLAQEADDLPPEIAATIRTSRGILRDRRQWHVTTEVGIAPDTNITGGTTADTIDLNLGGQTVPLELAGNARARSGLGQTGRVSASYRIGGGTLSWLGDLDTSGVNYQGKSADDFSVQIAVGPSIRFSDRTDLTLQGTGSQRWYGGERAATQFGARATFQQTIGDASRLGISFDARRTDSGFAHTYDGWNLAAYATYERVVARSMIASASLFVRNDRLTGKAYSSREFGLGLGIGGELSHGINAGLSASLGRAGYEAALFAFSPNPRRDWRGSVRAYAGLRGLRWMGFSPSVSYTYTRNASSLTLYDTRRSRFAFNLARYF